MTYPMNKIDINELKKYSKKIVMKENKLCFYGREITGFIGEEASDIMLEGYLAYIKLLGSALKARQARVDKDINEQEVVNEFVTKVTTYINNQYVELKRIRKTDIINLLELEPNKYYKFYARKLKKAFELENNILEVGEKYESQKDKTNYSLAPEYDHVKELVKKN